MDRDALPVGTQLAEYRIERVLGEGGFGIVYQAVDTILQRRVAIKEFLPFALAGRASGLEIGLRSREHGEAFARGLHSFLDEARLLAQFDHPSLVRVYRFWEQNNTAYMAMPYYEGRTLQAVRREMIRPPDEAWLRESLLLPLLGALEQLHAASCVHRDVSPNNILLLADGRPVLLDFGAARRVINDMTQPLTAILNPAYAPIEQYAESADVQQGPWTDIYSLAAVAYFALTGRAPVPAPVRAVNDALPPATSAAREIEHTFPGLHFGAPLLAALDAALAVHPRERLRSARAFREALLREHVLPDVAVEPAADTEPPVIRLATLDGVARADDVDTPPTHTSPGGPSLRQERADPPTPEAATSPEDPAEEAIRRAIHAAIGALNLGPREPTLTRGPSAPLRDVTAAAPAARESSLTGAGPMLEREPGRVEPRLEPDLALEVPGERTKEEAALASRAEPTIEIPRTGPQLRSTLDAGPGQELPPGQQAAAKAEAQLQSGAEPTSVDHNGNKGPTPAQRGERRRRAMSLGAVLAAVVGITVVGAMQLRDQFAPSVAVRDLRGLPPPSAGAGTDARETGVRVAAPAASSTVAVPLATPPAVSSTAPPVAVAMPSKPSDGVSATTNTSEAPRAEASTPQVPADQPSVDPDPATQSPSPPRTSRPPAARVTKASPSPSRHQPGLTTRTTRSPSRTSTTSRPATRNAAANVSAANPRAACSGRSNFALYYCLQNACKQARYSKSTQCKALRERDEVS